MVCPHCLWDLYGVGPPVLGDYICINCGLQLTIGNLDVLDVRPRRRKKLEPAGLRDRLRSEVRRELLASKPMLPWHGKLFTIPNLPTDYLTWWQLNVAIPGEPLTSLVAEELRKREEKRGW